MLLHEQSYGGIVEPILRFKVFESEYLWQTAVLREGYPYPKGVTNFNSYKIILKEVIYYVRIHFLNTKKSAND